MTWASRRRLAIIGILIGVVALAIGTTAFLSFHRAPSCFDNKQNQDEEGIDCGGSCRYACTASQAAPSVRFVRALSPVAGRTDVIAYIDNPNTSTAAKDLHYTVELYSSTNTVIAKGTGSVDLPPANTTPVYLSGFYSGSQEVTRAFITFDTPQHLWYRYQDDRILPKVVDVQVTEGDMPRIQATATNSSSVSLKNITFIVTVFDQTGNAIAASQTIAPEIAAHGTAPIVFTWPGSFSGSVSRVEIVPIVPLPDAPAAL